MSTETWDEIWLRKGREDTCDLKKLNGYEHTALNPAAAGRTIAEALELKPGQKFLDVGCGAGAIGQSVIDHVGDIVYVGTERSATLAQKHIALSGRPVLNFSAHEAVFSDSFFDSCLCYSVFQYFPSHDYAREVVGQLVRQAKTVYLGDLPIRSHDATHRLYTRELIQAWLNDLGEIYSGLTGLFSEGLYNPDRFNVLVKRP